MTVARLHEGSSSSISGGLGLVGGYDRDGECPQLNCLLCSVLLATDLLTPGGAIPARKWINCQHL